MNCIIDLNLNPRSDYLLQIRYQCSSYASRGYLLGSMKVLTRRPVGTVLVYSASSCPGQGSGFWYCVFKISFPHGSREHPWLDTDTKANHALGQRSLIMSSCILRKQDSQSLCCWLTWYALFWLICGHNLWPWSSLSSHSSFCFSSGL